MELERGRWRDERTVRAWRCDPGASAHGTYDAKPQRAREKSSPRVTTMATSVAEPGAKPRRPLFEMPRAAPFRTRRFPLETRRPLALRFRSRRPWGIRKYRC